MTKKMNANEKHLMLSDEDRALCVEMFISSKSFDQTRQMLVRKLSWDRRKTHLAPNNVTVVIIINRWANEFRCDRLFRRKQGSGRPPFGPLKGDPPTGEAVRPG